MLVVVKVVHSVALKEGFAVVLMAIYEQLNHYLNIYRVIAILVFHSNLLPD